MPTLKYVGDRPYVEFTLEGQTYGFARGTMREDIPTTLLDRFKGDNYPQWKVIGDKKVEEKTKKMVEVIEASVVEETPAVEAPVVEETPAVEEVAFSEEWTRGEMIKWFTARGETTPRKATKADLTALADALINPPTDTDGDE